jgi:lipopolysaccharide transport system permease protein
MLPFLTQIWMFVTPIAYPLAEAADKLAKLVPESLLALYYLNPMVGVVEGFRWALLGTTEVPTQAIIYSVAVSLVLLVSGMFYFRRMERTFADMV